MDAEKEKEAEKGGKKNAESVNSTFFFFPTTSKLDLVRYLVLRAIIGKNIRKGTSEWRKYISRCITKL